MHETVVVAGPAMEIPDAPREAAPPGNVELDERQACAPASTRPPASRPSSASPRGTRYLTLTRFSTSPGPDLRVRLGSGADLGALKGNRGDQQYRVPAGVAVEGRRRGSSSGAARSASSSAAPALRTPRNGTHLRRTAEAMTDALATTAAPPADALAEYRPIADYGLLADCNSAALVDRDGSIDWLCLPRYDSAAVFARLLDPDAGHWSIRPAGTSPPSAATCPGTLVVETTFTTDSGQRAPDGRHGLRRRPARARPRQRRAPRAAARRRGRLRRGGAATRAGAAARVRAGHARSSAVRGGRRAHVRRPGQVAVTRVRPARGRGLDDAGRLRGRRGRAARLRAALGAARGVARPSRRRPAESPARIADTAEAWRSWEAEHDIYEGPHRDLVRLSSRVLKGLTLPPDRRDRRRAHDLPARGRSAASATGTTASRGSATRASRSRRSTSAPARTRPRTSSPS